MSVSTQAAFESGHTDQIHDCQYDYYGRVSPPSSPDPSFYSENQTPRRSDARPPSPPTVAEGRDLLVRPHHQGVRCRRRAADALLANLTGHDGPVWMCAWAHPKFGTLLASCSFDHKVISKESEQGVFSAIYTSPATLHDASVNAISWAPHEFGLSLACASSDGCVSISPTAPTGPGTRKRFRARTRSAAPRCRGHPRLLPAPWSPPEAPPPRR